VTEWFVAGGILAILVLVAIAAAAWRVGRARGISFMHKDGTKSGGRKAGTPNKATRELKTFLDRVFTRAFTEKTKVQAPDGTELEVGLEDVLVAQIMSLSIDEGLLKTLLAYWAGAVPKAVDHKHSGKLTLEQLVAGVTPGDVDDDEVDG